MTEEELRRDFPLLPEDFAITSPEDENYNCIAWSINDIHRWWWPTPIPYPCYWPPYVPRDNTVDAFVKMYENLFFGKCDDRGREDGHDKVALYVESDGRPTHAARFWVDDPGWSSKLGEGNDIVHHSLEALEGPEYGPSYVS